VTQIGRDPVGNGLFGDRHDLILPFPVPIIEKNDW